MKLNLIDKISYRLVYSFFISDNIKSFDDHISYPIHFLCLKECLTSYALFDEAIFIIHVTDFNNPLIDELKYKLIEYSICIKKVTFIIEHNDSYEREGGIFNKYIIEKFNEYDGITLFFHNKGLNNVYGNDLENWCSYWVIGEYYYLMFFPKEFIGTFIGNDKLIYGWPYMHDILHPQWLIGGSCFWMKCQDIYKYINEKKLESGWITSKCISELFFPSFFDKELIDYPNSRIIKDYFDYVDAYVPANNKKFNEYLMEHSTYKDYVGFKSFYDFIVNKYIENKNKNNK